MKMTKALCITAALAISMLSAGCAGTPANTSSKAPETSAVQSGTESTETSKASATGELEPKITANPRSKNYDSMYDGMLEEEVTLDAVEYGATKSAEAFRSTNKSAVTDAPAAEAPATAAPAPGYEVSEIIDDIPKEPVVSYDGEGSEIVLPSDEPTPYDPSVQPKAGLLTAGEWNDNDNWGFFTNLVNTQKITLPVQYGVVPSNRTAVNIKDKSGAVVANASVKLLDDKGEVLWKAVSDHNGMAYLFAPDGVKPAAVEIESQGKTQKEELNFKTPDQQSEIKTENNNVEIVFDGEGKKLTKTDIMFVVDTTGSMGDELMFLQTEFTAIAENVGTDNTRFSINFYRDDGDEYTTKRYPFSSDIQEIQKKLNSESADGGGDLPEAVAEILDETITDGGWGEDSVKLMFLIFDAPPHEGKQEMLSKAIDAAAGKGIRIIPVVSSNSDRDTELFGRCIAIATGGTYVFLTDDSGIGYSHLEPIIGSYKVEKLYDIIVRLIDTYSA